MALYDDPLALWGAEPETAVLLPDPHNNAQDCPVKLLDGTCPEDCRLCFDFIDGQDCVPGVDHAD